MSRLPDALGQKLDAQNVDCMFEVVRQERERKLTAHVSQSFSQAVSGVHVSLHSTKRMLGNGLSGFTSL